jgi:hypothetical protein
MDNRSRQNLRKLRISAFHFFLPYMVSTGCWIFGLVALSEILTPLQWIALLSVLFIIAPSIYVERHLYEKPKGLAAVATVPFLAVLWLVVRVYDRRIQTPVLLASHRISSIHWDMANDSFDISLKSGHRIEIVKEGEKYRLWRQKSANSWEGVAGSLGWLASLLVIPVDEFPYRPRPRSNIGGRAEGS